MTRPVISCMYVYKYYFIIKKQLLLKLSYRFIDQKYYQT